jgi:hypothetical protein
MDRPAHHDGELWQCESVAATQPEGASKVNSTTAGIDLENDVFQIRAIDERRKVIVHSRQLVGDNPAKFNGPQESADLIGRRPAHSIRAGGQAQ